MNKILFLVVLCAVFTSCKQQPSKADNEVMTAVHQIDSVKGDFDPARQVNMQSTHWAITGKYSGGVYQLDSVAYYIRPGRLPYVQERKPAHAFVVSYYDTNGGLIGLYSIENPVNLKSCEPGKEGSKIADNVVFEILLPSNNAISNIQLDVDGKKAGSIRLPGRKIIDNGSERQSSDTTRTGRDSTKIIRR